jgi:hypothetical protein
MLCSDPGGAGCLHNLQAAGGQELTLEYSGSLQKSLVPEDTPILTTVPTDALFLQPGEYMSATTDVDANGNMTALRIRVSRDGVKPPR